MATENLTFSHIEYYADDNSDPDSCTSLASEDSALGDRGTGLSNRFIVRVCIENDNSANANNIGYSLLYDVDSDANWTQISSDGSNRVSIVGSSNSTVPDGTATDTSLQSGTASNGFSNGTSESGGYFTAPVTITKLYYTEIVFVVYLVDANVTDNEVIRFRACYANTTWNGTNAPITGATVTVDKAAAPVAKSGTDTGTLAGAADTIDLTDVSDAATLADTAAVTASPTPSDALTFKTSVIKLEQTGNAETLALADTGVADGGNDKSSTDTGTLSDTATVAASLSATDTGTLAETSTFALADTDSASLTDTGSNAAALSDSDTATLAETETNTVSGTGTDTGTVADTETISAATSDTDSATLTDAGTATAPKSGTDTATLADSATVAASTTESDTGTLAETETSTAALSATDTGTLADTGEKSEVGGVTDKSGTDTFTLADTAAVTVAHATLERFGLDDGANLLTANQASAEAGTTGWSNWNVASASSQANVAWHGDRAIKVVTTGTAAQEGASTLSAKTTVTPSQTYTASVYAKGSGTIRVALWEYTSADGFVGNTNGSGVALSSTWQRLTVTRSFGATGAKAGVVVETTSAESVTFYFDAAQLEVGSAATPFALPGGGGASVTAALSGSDTQTVVDTSTTAVALSGTDTGTLTDNGESGGASSQSDTDTGTLADTGTVAAADTASDTVTLADIGSGAVAGPVTDTADLTDIAIVTITAVDNVAATETGSITAGAATTDTATLVDSGSQSAAGSVAKSGTDALTLALSVLKLEQTGNAETVTLADTAASPTEPDKTGADTATLAESVSIAVTAAATETGTLVDTGSLGGISHTASDTFRLSFPSVESGGRGYKEVSDNIGLDLKALKLEQTGNAETVTLTDTASRSEPPTTLQTDTFNLLYLGPRKFVVGVAPGTAESATFASIVETTIDDGAAGDIILTDTGVVDTGGLVTRSASDSANLSETASVTASVSGTDSAALADTGQQSIGLVNKTASDSLTLFDGASELIIDFPGVSASDTDAITLADDGTVDATGEATPKLGQDAATLAETPSIDAPTAASDTAALSDTGYWTTGIGGTDSATLADAGALTPAGTGTDTGTLAESAVVVVALVSVDAVALATVVSIYSYTPGAPTYNGQAIGTVIIEARLLGTTAIDKDLTASVIIDEAVGASQIGV